jgi:hypothetical protein
LLRTVVLRKALEVFKVETCGQTVEPHVHRKYNNDTCWYNNGSSIMRSVQFQSVQTEFLSDYYNVVIMFTSYFQKYQRFLCKDFLEHPV